MIVLHKIIIDARGVNPISLIERLEEKTTFVFKNTWFEKKDLS
jgi:hypothetical protein